MTHVNPQWPEEGWDESDAYSEPVASDCEYIDAEIGATCQNFYDTGVHSNPCSNSHCWDCNACPTCRDAEHDPADVEIGRHDA